MGPVEVLWDGNGVPPERAWDQWNYYPPPPREGIHTRENITFSHPFGIRAAVKNCYCILCKNITITL